MNKDLIEKVVMEILDGRKDYYHEIRDAIAKAIPIIAEDEGTKIYNAMVTSMPVGECTAWDFIKWFKNFWERYQGEKR